MINKILDSCPPLLLAILLIAAWVILGGVIVLIFQAGAGDACKAHGGVYISTVSNGYLCVKLEELK